MSAPLVTNTVEIRGQSYLCKEMTARQMKAMRVLIASEKDKHRLDTWLVSECVEPKVTEAEAVDLPQFVIDRLSAEVLRLTREGETEPPKNG
jgi:hypothetical protein